MSTITARPAMHVPTSALVAVVAVVSVLAGLLIGYAVAPRDAPTATAAAEQVAHDNALVDRWVQVFDTGSREDFDEMVRPNVRFADNIGYAAQDADALWLLILEGRKDKHVHARTTDVVRIDDVLFWGAKWEIPGVANSEMPFTWTIRLDPNGRFVNIWETVH